MLGNFHAPFADVEDLTADACCERAVLKMRAAVRAGFRRMNDDLIWLCDLLESRAAMTALTAGLASRLLSEASGARGLLPWWIK